jgi:hypothetical protein
VSGRHCARRMADPIDCPGWKARPLRPGVAGVARAVCQPPLIVDNESSHPSRHGLACPHAHQDKPPD